MLEYKLFPLEKSWSDFPCIVTKELDLLKNGSIVIDIGGGSNPLLTKDQVRNFHYIVVDIDPNELAKANGDYYEKICTDIIKDNKGLKCDLLISNMLLEHIIEPKFFHEACFEILRTNGKAVHFFATKFSPASIINTILPESLSRKLLYLIQKRNWEKEGKFPAYYRWAMGPTKEQVLRFKSIGFEVCSYNGYLGSGYLKYNKKLSIIERIYNKIIINLNLPYFCSNAIVILKK